MKQYITEFSVSIFDHDTMPDLDDISLEYMRKTLAPIAKRGTK